MNEKQYSNLVQLSERSEAEKATLVAFFLLRRKGVESLTISNLCEGMAVFGLSRPNASRLKANLKKGRDFVKADGDKVRLHIKKLEALDSQYPSVASESEEIISDDTILPEGLYHNTRGYLVSVSKQINATYQHHLYDGCAMLMRRLIEMLIVLTYRHLKRESEVKDSNGNFHSLSYLINYSLSNKVLGLSRDSEEVLDIFRVLGNYSAHGLEYSCKKGDLSKVKIQFRACVEELLYKSGVKK